MTIDRRCFLAGALAAGAMLTAAPAFADTQISFYYPVAVGGPITTIVDRLDRFMLGYPPHCQVLAAETEKPLTSRPRPGISGSANMPSPARSATRQYRSRPICNVTRR